MELCYVQATPVHFIAYFVGSLYGATEPC